MPAFLSIIAHDVQMQMEFRAEYTAEFKRSFHLRKHYNKAGLVAVTDSI